MRLAHRPVGELHSVGPRAVSRADGLDQVGAGKVEAAEVVGGDPGRQAGGDFAVVGGPPLGLAVVVRAVAPRQEAEAVGLEFHRIESLNCAPLFVEALAEIARDTLHAPGRPTAS